MATASRRGSLPNSGVGWHSELSSSLLPPSRSMSYIVPRSRSIVARVMSLVGMLVSLVTVGMIMLLGRDLQMTNIAFAKQLADHEVNASALSMVTAAEAAEAASEAAQVAYHGGESKHSRGKAAAETTTSISLKASTFRKPEVLECQAKCGAAKNDSVSYPDALTVSSWIQSSGNPCYSAIGSELAISEAGSYIVICKAELSTVDHTGVVTGRRANSSLNRALKAQLALRVRFGDTKTLLKNDTGVVLHHLTYQLNTIVWLPADARLSLLLTSFAGLETTGSLWWHNVTIAWSRLGGDRPLQ